MIITDFSFLALIPMAQCAACSEWVPYTRMGEHECPEGERIAAEDPGMPMTYLNTIPKFAYAAYSRGRHSGV